MLQPIRKTFFLVLSFLLFQTSINLSDLMNGSFSFSEQQINLRIFFFFPERKKNRGFWKMIRLTRNGLYPFYQWSLSFLFSRGFLSPLWLLAAFVVRRKQVKNRTQFFVGNPLCFVNALMEMLSFFFVMFETKLSSIFFSRT